jgi:glycosyltransferase involved in cell wall biosynthesis
MLSAGPAMALETGKYEALAEYFNGDIISSTSVPELLNIKSVGSFNLLYVKYDWDRKQTNVIRLLIFCIKYAVMCRIKNRCPEIVTTYDPLKTGLFGLMIAFVTGAKFVPEVNGVYNTVAKSLHKGIVNRVKAKAFPALQKFVLNRADGIKLLFPQQIDDIVLSNKKRVIESFPCYVNIESFFNKTEFPEREEILFVGFPFWIKGVDVLIAAFKKISDVFPSWTLKILGWYPDKTELERHIAGHPRIEYHKPVFPKDMPEHICSCSIFVLPSRTEAMGRVLVEAMAARKARIGADVDGIPTVINDGIDGLLFKKEDSAELSQKLALLMSDADLRMRLANEGLKRINEEFTKDRFALNTYKFLSEVVKNHKQNTSGI